MCKWAFEVRFGGKFLTFFVDPNGIFERLMELRVNQAE